MDAKLRPLGDRVLVRVAKAEEKVGAIIVPDAAKKAPLKGEVLAVGPGRWNDAGTICPKPGVAAGDVVLFTPYAGTDVGDGLLLLAEADVLAVEVLPKPAICETFRIDPKYT